MPCHARFPARHCRTLHRVVLVDGAGGTVHERLLFVYERGERVHDCRRMHFGDGKNDIIFFLVHVSWGKKVLERVFAKHAGGRIDMH